MITEYNTSVGDRNVPAGNIPVSRYGLIPGDLRLNAMTLSIGQGMADRFNSPDAIRFIVEGELWAEAQVSAYLAVPLKPVALPPGLTPPSFTPVSLPSPPVPFPPADPIRPEYPPEVSIEQQGLKWNYPYEFIQAAIFMAISKMLKSEYFEVEPNLSQASQEAETRAFNYLFGLRRSTILVGAGRRRNPNSHMPPNIAPVGTFPTNMGWGQR